MMNVDTEAGTQYLTFTLGEELFAIFIGKVREVLEFTTVTKVPRTPEFMEGVINLRGSVVPVVDLRRKFGMPEVDRTIETCIVIVEVEIEEEMVILGALVDSVEEVLELDAGEIEPAPRMGTSLRTEFIRGMGKRDDRFIIILDIDRVFSSDDISAVQDVDADSRVQVGETED